MSLATEPVPHLARSWNLPNQYSNLTAGDRMTACRWIHELPEFDDTVIPTNALVLVMQHARSKRLRSGRTSLASQRRGGIGLVAEGSDGRWEFDGPVDVFHFYMSNAVLRQIADAEGLRTFVGLQEHLVLHDPVLATLAGETAQACMEGEEGRLYASTLGLAMGMRLIRRYSNLGKPMLTSPVSGGLTTWQLRNVIEAMQSSLSSVPSIQALAEIARLSPFHFARAFKASTGKPPHLYLTQMRIEKARDLLESSELSVGEVAAQVGYDDPSYFARLFRRVMGATPAAYRRERRR